MTSKQTSAPRQSGKKTKNRTSLGLVTERRLDDLKPSPENDLLYDRTNGEKPDDIALAQSVAQDGVKEPLVISLDDFILSGHRRYFAARRAGLSTVPIRLAPIRRSDYDQGAYLKVLRDYNLQREKTFAEKLREELVTVEKGVAYESLLAHRKRRAEIQIAPLAIREAKRRASITKAKQPMLDAVLAIIEEQKEFWPLSIRRIHYILLDDPPLRHASKPKSQYANNKESYNDLSDLVTRARVVGEIPMDVIDDETRPEGLWIAYRDVRDYAKEQLRDFMRVYWRDLMQSQPHHVEIVVEKNTVFPIVKTVAMDFCIPITSGRGYCSLSPRYKMSERFKASGKEKLVVIIVSDHDPDGEEICHSFARSMRDDFELDVHAVKAALTREQVNQYNLPPQLEAKKSSANYKRFVDQYGKHCYEIEALPAKTLQTIVRDVIDAVIDREAFNAELDKEKNEQLWLAATRNIAIGAMKGADFELE